MVFRIEVTAVQSLIDILHQQKYSVIGPTQRGGSIVYDEITSSGQLPEGWTDEQSPGQYRLRKRSDRALFGFAVGPHSWKKFLFPPIHTLVRASRKGNGFSYSGNGEGKNDDGAPKYAFLGVRPCELCAIDIQDKVFSSAAYQDPYYRKVRDQLFVVAVNCSSPSDSCFCSSMGTGPKVTSKCDWSLTEVIRNGEH